MDNLTKKLISNFIERVQDALFHLNITQVELAKGIGVQKEMVNCWLKKKHIPRLDYVIKICLYIDSIVPGIMLNCTIEELTRDIDIREILKSENQEKIRQLKLKEKGGEDNGN